MKAILLTMISCYIFVFWFGSLFENFIFPGGGVAETYLKPIYLGIVFLSGLIVGCTVYLAEIIREQKRSNEGKEQQNL